MKVSFPEHLKRKVMFACLHRDQYKIEKMKHVFPLGSATSSLWSKLTYTFRVLHFGTKLEKRTASHLLFWTLT